MCIPFYGPIKDRPDALYLHTKRHFRLISAIVDCFKKLGSILLLAYCSQTQIRRLILMRPSCKLITNLNLLLKS